MKREYIEIFEKLILLFRFFSNPNKRFINRNIELYSLELDRPVTVDRAGPSSIVAGRNSKIG